MGVSPELQKQGMLCVSYPRSDLKIETEKEDEVYELQFGHSSSSVDRLKALFAPRIMITHFIAEIDLQAPPAQLHLEQNSKNRENCTLGSYKCKYRTAAVLKPLSR